MKNNQFKQLIRNEMNRLNEMVQFNEHISSYQGRVYSQKNTDRVKKVLQKYNKHTKLQTFFGYSFRLTS